MNFRRVLPWLVSFFPALVFVSPAPATPPSPIAAPAVSVAASANLVYALDALHAAFKRTAPNVALTVAVGASGSLYAQIAHGAPFDIFLSADTDYPHQAIAAGLAPPDSLRLFATGRLVLWTTRPGLDVSNLAAAVRSPHVQRLALAQPRTAPYGRAAQAVLAQLQLSTVAQPKLVFGESVTQAAQFVETGSADAGFVALSLVLSPKLSRVGRWHEIPATAHPAVSLDHAAVLTLRGAKNPSAQRYLDFLATAPAQKILQDFGYATPSPKSPK